MKLLILGGYGSFGGRLARLLLDEPGLTLMIAGRSREKGDAFCATLPPGAARRTALAFDRDGDVVGQLREKQPALVIDASGPFQAYGDDPYRVVKACVALGIDYMDFADGSDFVGGIREFDAEARRRGRFVLAGVSSFPVLTAAAIRALSRDIAAVETVAAGIAPSPFAELGISLIRALTGYAGKPVPLIRGGRRTVGYALTETLHYVICVPGRVPLRTTLFSLVDVPDLRLLPELWPELHALWAGAGPAPEILHRAFIGLAWLVRLRLLPSLAPLAPLIHRVRGMLRWGERRSGMFVAITGRDRRGKSVARSWHLIAEGAEGDDGPFIPAMGLAILVGRSLAGNPPPAGARPATEELELADYGALFRRRKIFWGQWEIAPDTALAPLYRRLLGEAWLVLPPPLRAMHDVAELRRAKGMATVERGRGFLARTLGWIMGFPDPGHDIPVEVSFAPADGRETWRRNFAGRSFSSVQEEGRGRWARLLVERFGPIAIALALVVEEERLNLVVRGWSFLGMPLPQALAPKAVAFESVEQGRFCFSVEIGHRLTGLITRYRGWLLPHGVSPRPDVGPALAPAAGRWRSPEPDGCRPPSPSRDRR